MTNPTRQSNYLFVEWYQYQNTHYRFAETKRNAIVTSVLGNEDDNNRNFIALVHAAIVKYTSNYILSSI